MQRCYSTPMHHQCTVPVTMHATWMFRPLVRYMLPLYTNVEHASLPQRTKATSVHCDSGCELDIRTDCAAMTLQ